MNSTTTGTGRFRINDVELEVFQDYVLVGMSDSQINHDLFFQLKTI